MCIRDRGGKRDRAALAAAGTAATDTGATGSAPADGFDPTLLKDAGFFKQFGGGGGTAADRWWNQNTECVGRPRSYGREAARLHRCLVASHQP